MYSVYVTRLSNPQREKLHENLATLIGDADAHIVNSDAATEDTMTRKMRRRRYRCTQQ